jgi:hypothetical protein
VIAGVSDRPTLAPRRRWAPRTHLMLLAVGAAAFAGLVLLLYATSIHTAAGTSDKATTILVGQAMGDGHLLLAGWTLPPGNYWTTDAAFYAVAVRLFGLRPGLLYAEPAIVAAVMIVVGVLIARGGRRGAAAIAGAGAVVALLVFATPAMDLWFVGNGFHIATALYALVALAALGRGGFGWRWGLSVALLAFGMVGDLEIVVFAVVPLFLGGLVAMARRRTWRSGVAQVTAAVATVVVGELALRVAHAVGAFEPGPPLPIADVSQMLTNVEHVFTYGADLVGLTNGRFGTGGVPLALLGAHVAGGLCLIASLLGAFANLVVGIVRGPGRDRVGGPELWRLDDLLLLATVSSAAPFVLLAGPNGVGIHFLSVPVVFATVLTGRMVAGAWSKLPTRRAARAVAVVGVAVSLTFAAGLGYALSRATPTAPSSTLASWLEVHDLHSGIAGYWTAAITTVESGGAVEVRPVGIAINGHVRRMMTQSSAGWYAGQDFEFYVSDAPPSGTDFKTAEWTWGTPSHVYVVGSYWVLVWGHPLRVSALSPTESPPGSSVSSAPPSRGATSR